MPYLEYLSNRRQRLQQPFDLQNEKKIPTDNKSIGIEYFFVSSYCSSGRYSRISAG